MTSEETSTEVNEGRMLNVTGKEVTRISEGTDNE